MKSLHPTLLVAFVAVVAFAASAGAEEVKPTVRLASFQSATSDLGFASQHISGFGVQVTEVNYGSKAYRLGLERDDVILSVNGRRLACSKAWNDALEHARTHGGKLALTIRDSHTGLVAVRHTSVFSR